jgi:hypothetical protein
LRKPRQNGVYRHGWVISDRSSILGTPMLLIGCGDYSLGHPEYMIGLSLGLIKGRPTHAFFFLDMRRSKLS